MASTVAANKVMSHSNDTCTVICRWEGLKVHYMCVFPTAPKASQIPQLIWNSLKSALYLCANYCKLLLKVRGLTIKHFKPGLSYKLRMALYNSGVRRVPKRNYQSFPQNRFVTIPNILWMDNIMLSHHPTRVFTLISAVKQIYNVPLSMKKLPVNLNTVKNIDCKYSMNIITIWRPRPETS